MKSLYVLLSIVGFVGSLMAIGTTGEESPDWVYGVLIFSVPGMAVLMMSVAMSHKP